MLIKQNNIKKNDNQYNVDYAKWCSVKWQWLNDIQQNNHKQNATKQYDIQHNTCCSLMKSFSN